MKKIARVLSLLMSLSMTAAVFTSCSNENPTTSSSDPSSTGGSSEAPKEVVTLNWWHWGDAPKNGDAVIEALNAKSEKDIGVKINFIWATGDDQKLKTALSTGTADDIAFTCSWFALYQTAAQKGQLLDLTESIKTVTPDLYNFIPEFVWDGAKVNQKIYAVPTYKDVASTNYWFCNKEYVIDGAGAEAEFMEPGERNAVKTPLMKKLKEYADSGHPYPHDLTAPYVYNFQGPRTVSTGYDTVQGDVYLGTEFGDETHTVKLIFEMDNYVADLKTLNEWYKAGYVNGDCAQLEKEPEFCVVNQAAGWKGAEKSVWGLNKDYTVAICARTTPIATTSTVTGSMQGIFANSKHPTEALKFIEYMNLNEDYRNMLGYGIKDINYKDNGDGTITSLNSDWQPGLFSQATFYTLKPASPAPATMYSDMKVEMEQAKGSELLGFVSDIAPVKNEVAACTATIEKYKVDFLCGTMKDVDASLAQLKNELNAVGFQKVIDEMQRQVDEFIASKNS